MQGRPYPLSLYRVVTKHQKPSYMHIYISGTSKPTNMEDMLLLYSSLSLLVVAIAFKLIYLRTRTKHLPPSPRSLPIIGHLHLLKKTPHRTLHHLSQKYGQIYSLRFGSRLVVVLSSPSAVEECFTKNNIGFANHPPSRVGKHVGYNNTTFGGVPYGDL
jgi:isoflavone 2'-hydroxylase